MNPESRNFTGAPTSVAEARAFVADHFTAGTTARDEAILLISEVATNAVRHVGGGYTITVDVTTTVTRVLVKDPGGVPTVPRPRPASDYREGGRGLALVEACAAAWGTMTAADGGCVVWFDIAAA